MITSHHDNRVAKVNRMTVIVGQSPIVEHLKQPEFAIIEDSGHLSTMEQPQAATALLRQWLLYG